MKGTKKIWVFLLIGVLGISTARGQTFSEWWRQKKTQKKYLFQQIAALQLYIGYARKGYSIAKEGLHVVEGFKRGEFDLHSDYFLSLGKVNPDIKEYARITEIIALQYQMVRDHTRTLKHLRQSGAFNGEELDYLIRVFGKTLDYTSDTLDELIDVSIDGNLEMTDDARLERIDILYQRMMEHYSFFQGFSRECTLLAVARLREDNDARTSLLLYNLKQ